MRIIAILFLCAGLVLLIDSANDERTGLTTAMSPIATSTVVSTADRNENPEDFRNLMIYNWGCAGLTVFAAFVIWALARRADELDPFSERFQGAAALDDMERTLDQEKRRWNRPLR